jgi:hypothetical protein
MVDISSKTTALTGKNINVGGGGQEQKSPQYRGKLSEPGYEYEHLNQNLELKFKRIPTREIPSCFGSLVGGP